MPGTAVGRLARLLQALRGSEAAAQQRVLKTLARRRERAATEGVARLLRDPLPAMRAGAAREAIPKTAW